jgi:hypothetical protein
LPLLGAGACGQFTSSNLLLLAAAATLQSGKKETHGGSNLSRDQVGLMGTIPIIFNQGSKTRSIMAWPGQLRNVASQAG